MRTHSPRSEIHLTKREVCKPVAMKPLFVPTRPDPDQKYFPNITPKHLRL